MNNPPVKLPQEITFDWSPELVKTCARRFILRGSRRTQALLLLLLALGVFCIVQGALGGWILIGFCVWLVSLFVRRYLRTVRFAEQRSDRKVAVHVEPESITFHTSQKESELKWSEIREIWSLPDVLMLFPAGSSDYIALPVAAIGEDVRQFIEGNVKQHGGKVA